MGNPAMGIPCAVAIAELNVATPFWSGAVSGYLVGRAGWVRGTLLPYTTVRVTVPVGVGLPETLGVTVTATGISSMVPVVLVGAVAVTMANVGATPLAFTPTGALDTLP